MWYKSYGNRIWLRYIQDDSPWKINILVEDSIGHYAKRSSFEHVSKSESQPLTEMITSNISWWVKAAGA